MWHDKNHNEVGVIMYEQTSKDAVEVCRKNNRIIEWILYMAKRFWRHKCLCTISVDSRTNYKEIMGGSRWYAAKHTNDENLYIRRNSNEPVEVSHRAVESDYRRLHEDLGFGTRNEQGYSFLKFTTSYNFSVGNNKLT